MCGCVAFSKHTCMGVVRRTLAMHECVGVALRLVMLVCSIELSLFVGVVYRTKLFVVVYRTKVCGCGLQHHFLEWL